MGPEIHLAIVAILAGVLTALSPCVLPLLPVIVGRSAQDVANRKKPLIITMSLMVSVFVFTLLLKASTALIDVPLSTWQLISGGIIITFGILTLYPDLWDRISLKLNLSSRSSRLLANSAKEKGTKGDILVGASLGPVFTSCSPTFALIIGLIIGGDNFSGIVYLTLYTLGFGATIFAFAIAGQSLISKLGWATNPEGKFKKILGLIFILVGLSIITGFDKTLESWILDGGVYEWILSIEAWLQGK